MLCIGVNQAKFYFDTSQLCCGVVHLYQISDTENRSIENDLEGPEPNA